MVLREMSWGEHPGDYANRISTTPATGPIDIFQFTQVPQSIGSDAPWSQKGQEDGRRKRGGLASHIRLRDNAGLVELIKEAFAIRNQFLSGSHDSIEAMSGRLGMNKGRLTSLVRLSYLGPEIVRALLAGSQANALTPSRLLRLSKNLPHDWKEQRCFLGFAA